jgi:hypothetical protein
VIGGDAGLLRFVRIDYADRDELTPALTRTWNKRLAEHGFQRVGRRDLQSFSNGIVRLFNFQISARGSRDFCVNAAACTLCGNEHPVLQPGFRLRNQNGGDMWLGASTTETAAISVEIAWEAAEAQALPWLEQNATLAGQLEILRAETWSSRHHLLFQIGIVEAMLGQRDNAAKNLTESK